MIADQRDNGRPLYLVGVEKTGEMRDFADSYTASLEKEDRPEETVYGP